MLNFTKDQWLGNNWMSIEIKPVAATYMLPILWHLSKTYHFEMPKIVDTLDGYTTQFEVLRSAAMLLIDNWTFSIAFENGIVPDQVLTKLCSLPENYFEQKSGTILERE